MFKNLLAIAFCLVLTRVFAQDIRFDYSNPIKFSAKTGFPSGTEVYGKDFIYVDKIDRHSYFHDENARSKRRFLDVVKKSDNTLLKTVQYLGKDSKERGFTIVKKIFLKDRILIFFQKRGKKGNFLAAKAYDLEMNLKQPFQVVLEFPYSKQMKNAEFFVFRNYDDEHALIGIEFPSGDRSKSPYVDYKMLSSDLASIAGGKFELPYYTSGEGVSRPTFIPKGEKILFTYTLSKNAEQKKESKPGESNVYLMLSYLDSKTAEIQNVPLKFPGKNIISSRINVDDKGLSFMGLYSVYENDWPYPNRLRGFFNARIDDKDLTLKNIQMDTLSDPFVNTFDRMSYDQEANAYSTNNNSSEYVLYIESYNNRPDGGFDLFITNRYQYSITTCNRKTGDCVTTYYAHKKGIGLIQTNANGKVVFAKSHQRSRFYNTWNLTDVVAMHAKENLYLFYNTCLDYENIPDNQFPKIMKNKMLDKKIEYVVVNDKNPEFNRKYKTLVKNPAIGKVSSTFSMVGAQESGGMIYNTTYRVSRNPLMGLLDYTLLLPITICNQLNPVVGNCFAKGKYYIRTIREL